MTQIKTQLRITRDGVKCPNFLNFAQMHRNWFLSSFTYSKENLEMAYQIRFCCIQTTGNRLYFTDQPMWGKNIVYFAEKLRKARKSSFSYVRLSAEKIM